MRCWALVLGVLSGVVLCVALRRGCAGVVLWCGLRSVRSRRASVAVGAGADAAARAAQAHAAAEAGGSGSHGQGYTGLHADGERLRRYNGAMNVSTTSSKPPREIFFQLKAALEKHGVTYEQTATFALLCSDLHAHVRFAVEVCRLDSFDRLYVLYAKRVQGDTWAYKDVYGRIVATASKHL
eukprot:gnl/Ergobibamus_cyprinoides/5714.p2 GENE.gnl/Ergobibamus_cyprinoides/5714~~gnl/Ergobibamus_cyprinoides/5714.p2  ORF type:complete len:182 (+),score=28.78 gnl/Ergobibamus_cyprinoides/5714:199-744(+)